MLKYQIKLKRLNDHTWEWSVFTPNFLNRGLATSETFAFCWAVRTLMQSKGYKDEASLLHPEALIPQEPSNATDRRC